MIYQAGGGLGGTGAPLYSGRRALTLLILRHAAFGRSYLGKLVVTGGPPSTKYGQG